MPTNWYTLTILSIVNKSRYTKYKLVLDTYIVFHKLIVHIVV